MSNPIALPRRKLEYEVGSPWTHLHLRTMPSTTKPGKEDDSTERIWFFNFDSSGWPAVLSTSSALNLSTFVL